MLLVQTYAALACIEIRKSERKKRYEQCTEKKLYRQMHGFWCRLTGRKNGSSLYKSRRKGKKKRRRRREKGREYEEGYSHEYRVDLERDLVGLKIDVVEG